MAYHARTTNRVRGALGRGLVEHRIQAASCDERHLLLLRMHSQFQHTVGRIAHHLDRVVGKPAAHQADHLLGPHRYCLVSLAQLFTDLRAGCQHTEERQSPTLLGPGKCDHHCHHDPAQARTAHRLFATGERTIPVMAALADLAAEASFQRFIDHQIHAFPGRHKGRDNEKQEVAAHR